MADPLPKYARVRPSDPSAWGQCDRCSFWYSLRDLTFQFEWAGTHLYSTGDLVCPRCLDVPQEQLRTIILPPDPQPVFNARVPNFAYEEQTVMIAQFGGGPNQSLSAPNAQPPWQAGPQLILCDQSGEIPLILQFLTSS